MTQTVHTQYKTIQTQTQAIQANTTTIHTIENIHTNTHNYTHITKPYTCPKILKKRKPYKQRPNHEQN